MARDDAQSIDDAVDDEGAAFWVVIHYDPDRPDTNIFGSGPYQAKGEALAKAAAINAQPRRCQHPAKVVPVFWGRHVIVATYDTGPDDDDTPGYPTGGVH